MRASFTRPGPGRRRLLRVTAKASPPGDRSAGVAVPDALVGREAQASRPAWESVIATADHAGSEMVPVWPVALVALTLPKLVVPKSASGSARQPPLSPHADGASTIHSAELTSTCATSSCLENDVPRVRSAMKSFTEWPETRDAGRHRVARADREPQLDGRRGHELVPGRVVALAAGAVGLGADLLERLGGRVQAAEAEPDGRVAPAARRRSARRARPRCRSRAGSRALACSVA